MNGKRTAVIGALAVATTMAMGAGAAQAAQPTFKQAKFKVEVEGVQTNKWGTSHVDPPGTGPCGVNFYGNGTEVVRFKTNRPGTLTIMDTGRAAPFVLVDNRKLRATARITRKGIMRLFQAEPGFCSDGTGQGAQPPKPEDCGTKTYNLWFLEVGVLRNRIEMDNQVAPLGPFLNCPSGGVSFGSMLNKFQHKGLNPKFPTDDMLERDDHKQWIIPASGNYRQKNADGESFTTLRWQIKLTRIK